jgi:hypothetical protein
MVIEDYSLQFNKEELETHHLEKLFNGKLRFLVKVTKEKFHYPIHYLKKDLPFKHS